MRQFGYSVSLCVIFCVFDYSLALSSQCYACHGEYCNDPFNRDRATVMTCSNSAKLLVDGRGFGQAENLTSVDGKFGEWDSLETKLWNLFNNIFGNSGTTEHVCAKSSYYNNVHQINMTLRRCVPKNFKGMEACTYLSNIINSGYGRVRSCTFCDTDLCNSGISLRNSFMTIFVFIVLKIIF